MKRVLIISYYWPPTGGSGVQRWVKFAKYLPQLGWQPVVYTPENPERLAVDESLLTEVPVEAEVIRTHITEPYDIYRRIFRHRKKKEGGVNPLNAQNKSLIQKITVWVRGNFFVPDPRVGWVRPSVKYLRKYLETNPVDVIVTTGPPQSMHLIGLGLKKATGIRWIADFRDPWTEMFYFKHMGLWPLAKLRHKRLEQQVLDNADRIIAVSPPVAEDFRARTSTPVELITNGFDESDFAQAASASATAPCTAGTESALTGPATAGPRSFVIAHTGLFAADGNPLELWDCLAAKCAGDSEFRQCLRIRLAGKVDPEICEAIKARGLGDNLVNLGYLPHFKTVEEQRSASVLILPLRQEPEYAKVLPGKIFEYLAARRPVLGIGQEDGAAAAILRETGAGIMYDWDRSEPVRSFIDSQWEKYRTGDFKPLENDISMYSRRALTERLTQIL